MPDLTVHLCRLCRLPIRPIAGHESRPPAEACWTHVSGGYVCPTEAGKAGSEFSTATYDPNPELTEDRLEETPPEDYCI